MIEGVRYAAPGDIARVVELAHAEHAASRWHALPFDEAYAGRTAAAFIGTMGRTLLVTDGGFMAGMVQPLGFSPSLVALEYAWYAHDGSGLKLLRAFERWAASVGARSVVVHSFLADPRIVRVLAQRRGYVTMGGAMAKDILKEQAWQ